MHRRELDIVGETRREKMRGIEKSVDSVPHREWKKRWPHWVIGASLMILGCGGCGPHPFNYVTSVSEPTVIPARANIEVRTDYCQCPGNARAYDYGQGWIDIVKRDLETNVFHSGETKIELLVRIKLFWDDKTLPTIVLVPLLFFGMPGEKLYSQAIVSAELRDSKGELFARFEGQANIEINGSIYTPLPQVGVCLFAMQRAMDDLKKKILAEGASIRRHLATSGAIPPQRDRQEVAVPPTPSPSRPSVAPSTTPPGTKGGEMVLVPAGEFTMGSNHGKDDEQPAHRVYLDTFFIDTYEVTNAQYAEFMRSTGHTPPYGDPWPRNTRQGQNPPSGYEDHPVVGVSWLDAQAYCQWAGKRLPTEAEWEKAARGTDGRTYPWGEQEATCEYAVLFDRKVNKWPFGIGCGRPETWPVGSKPNGVSPYGAHDMAGNVAEWVSDWYALTYYARSPKSNPSGPEKGVRIFRLLGNKEPFRVVRGGNWAAEGDGVRSSGRGWGEPHRQWPRHGFRCAR